MESEFIGRQPIVNRGQDIVGYRLVFGGVPDVQYERDSETAVGSAPGRDLVLQFERVLAGATGFIEIDTAALDSSFLEALKAKQFVVEIGSIEGHDPKVVARQCAALRERGLRICLGDYARRDSRQALLEHANYIKIDALAMSSGETKSIVRRMRGKNVEVIASRVDLPAQFESLAESGIDLFQGYFYATHDPRMEKQLSPDRARIVELLAAVSTGADLPVIEEAFKKNANLGVSLLRLVNGLQLARSNKIDTVSQALVMIGVHGLSRWLNILLFAGSSDDGATGPLFKLASSRGKLMELLQLDLLGPDPGREEAAIADRAFLVGMLSLAHVVLGVSEGKAAGELSLSKEVRAALEAHEGRQGALLKFAKCIEEADFETGWGILDSLGLTREQFEAAQVESLAWANGL